jgi:hypothetical protein
MALPAASLKGSGKGFFFCCQRALARQSGNQQATNKQVDY